MVSKRISELPAAGALDGSEQIPLTQDGETRRISGDTYQQRGLIDVFIDSSDAAANDAAISDALTSASANAPTKIRLLAYPGQTGYGPISTQIDLSKNGNVMVAEGKASEGFSGVRLIWEGAAGALMMVVSAQRAGIEGICLDANSVAADCIRFDNHPQQHYKDITVANYSGTGVQIGNGTANNNEFVGHGVLECLGLEGSEALRVDAPATEDTHLETVFCNESQDATSAASRAVFVNAGNLTIENLMITSKHKASFTNHPVRVRGTSLRVGNWTSETPLILTFDSVSRSRGSHIGTADFRSLDPGSGEYVIRLEGGPSAGDDTTPQQQFTAGSLHFETKSGGTSSPDIYVNNMLAVIGLSTASVQTDGDPVGGNYTVTSTGGAIVGTDDGFRLYNQPIFVPEEGVQGFIAGVARRLLWKDGSDNLRIGEGSDWPNAYCDIASGSWYFRVAVDILGQFSDTIAEGETALYLRRNNGTLSTQRVSEALADSANVEHGTATIADTNTSVTVAHNLGVVPNVQVSPVGAYDDLHVANKTTTSFDVVRPGTSGAQDFDWSAHGTGHRALRLPN